ncbi:MAG TPA: VWA domain-containing protein [Pyrinomonadaceae bacterium]|nr:VWA domain-containing protein [Pyrinomonadaceae bacterium]
MKDTRAGARRGRPAARRLAQLFCASVCLLALFSTATLLPLRAQSGRKKTSTTLPREGNGSQRPRTVNTSTPLPAPSPLATEDKSGAAPTQNPAAATSLPVPASPKQTPSAVKVSDDSEEVDEDEVVRINSNLVPVPATVIDARGRAVTDLQLKDFELSVNGEVKPIGDLSRSDAPVSMAVLFDNSSSIRAGREFEKQAAIRFFRNVMRPADRAAVYSVSTVPTLVRPLTSDVKSLVRTVENFPSPEGATALFDAIAAAADYLKLENARKVIVLISDGSDTISDLDFDATLARALARDCQIYAVQTGHSDNTNLRDLAAERRLQEFTAQTGGAVYVPRSDADLGDAFAQIAADLAQQYILGYYPTDARRDGRFNAFSLRITTRPGLRVRTRKGYYSPKG